MEYYIFAICANNTSQLGWGSEAKIIVYTIEGHRRSRPDSPNKPVIGKSSIKTNQLTINWNANSENYSPLRYFTIQINEINVKNRKNDLFDYLNNTYETILNKTEINYFNFDLNWRTIYKYVVTSTDNMDNFRISINGNFYRMYLIMKN